MKRPILNSKLLNNKVAGGHLRKLFFCEATETSVIYFYKFFFPLYISVLLWLLFLLFFLIQVTCVDTSKLRNNAVNLIIMEQNVIWTCAQNTWSL